MQSTTLCILGSDSVLYDVLSFTLTFRQNYAFTWGFGELNEKETEGDDKNLLRSFDIIIT